MDTYRLRKMKIAIITAAVITVTIMSNPITSPGTLKGKSTDALRFSNNRVRLYFHGNFDLHVHTSFSCSKDRIMHERL